MSDIVQAFKDRQRSDPAFRDSWVKYCDENKQGIRDPARCSPEELSSFLEQAGAPGMNPFAAPGAGVLDPEMEDLVRQVKEGQRNDVAFKLAWGTYCEKSCAGIRDPSRHPADSLRTFLRQMESGAGAAGNSSAEDLVQQIKDGQRNSTQFKEEWGTFCDTQCQGIRDPTRHPVENLRLFISTLGQGKKMGVGGGGNHFGSGNELVTQIKERQRSEPGFKQNWEHFCDTMCEGIRDPMRHPPQNLKLFLDQNPGYAQPGAGMRPAPNYAQRGPPDPYAQSYGVPAAPAYGGPGGDLVQHIKDGQRQDPAFREMWWKFCDTRADGIRDPSRHPVQNLQFFLDTYQKISGGPGMPPVMPMPSMPSMVMPTQKFGGAPAADMSDPGKAALVQMIKANQRADAGFKDAWGVYCDMHGQGNRDPNRHTSDVLRSFLAERGLAPPGGNYGPASFMPKRNALGQPY
jgi:hypothetical protein